MARTREVTILSLGGGVQSTALALMLDKGTILDGCPRPDAAVFADTQAEPPWVYETLDALESRLSYPIIRAMHGNLEADTWAALDAKAGPDAFLDIPVYHYGSLSRRQCTTHYKIAVIRRAIRQRFGWPISVTQYIGISLDEAMRMKDSDVAYIQQRYPLVEHRLTRQHCIAWLADEYPQIKAGKSSCFFCPFHSKAAWRSIQQDAPDLMRRAIRLDDALQSDGYGLARRGTLRRLAAELSAQPELPLDDPPPGDECAGVCFV